MVGPSREKSRCEDGLGGPNTEPCKWRRAIWEGEIRAPPARETSARRVERFDGSLEAPQSRCSLARFLGSEAEQLPLAWVGGASWRSIAPWPAPTTLTSYLDAHHDIEQGLRQATEDLGWAREIPFQGDNGGVSRLQARRGRAGVVLAFGSG